jgi:protein-disulfide isomerase
VITMTASARPSPLLRLDEAIDHVQGAASAPVTLIEYGDYECPSCFQATAALKFILPHFSDGLRFAFRHFPLREVHPHAELAAEAAEAAGAQGKFWSMHDLLFANQHHLKEKHLQGYALQLGLDMARYENEMRDHVYLQRVQEQILSGQHLAIRSTPAFYVNGIFTDVSFGLELLHQAIERALAA